MKNLFRVSIFALSIFTFSQCHEKEDQIPEVNSATERKINFQPAKTYSEYLKVLGDPNNNVVRNKKELEKIMTDKSTPMSKLSQKNQALLLENAKFSTYGLSTIKYTTLKNNLTESEYVDVMLIFGIDVKYGYWGNAGLSSTARTTEDYWDYICTEHTCRKESGYLCVCN